MNYSQIDQKLALERCRLYVAQLCAAHYFDGAEIAPDESQNLVVERLLRSLSQDLEVWEEGLAHSD